MGILREKFAHLNLVYSIGGQISFDIFPQVLCHARPTGVNVILIFSLSTLQHTQVQRIAQAVLQNADSEEATLK